MERLIWQGFSKEEIIARMELRVDQEGYYKDFFIAVTDKPNERLDAHKVPDKPSCEIFEAPKGNGQHNREIAQHFIEKGCKGDVKFGGEAKYIYWYLMTESTQEDVLEGII